MNGNYIGTIIVIAVLLVGGWFLFKGAPAQAPATEVAPVTNQVPVVGSTTPEMIVENTVPDVTVTYSDTGFTPKEITITLGTKVNFVNQSSKGMWVASAKHPDHTVYSGTGLIQHCPDTTNTSFDECTAVASGGSYSFIFNKEGTWKYHNHVDATKFGTVIVTPTVSATISVPVNI